MLLYIYFKTVPPPRKNVEFGLQLPFYFFMEKHLLKVVVVFSLSDQDCVSIASELCKEFNTRFLLNIYFRIPSLL